MKLTILAFSSVMLAACALGDSVQRCQELMKSSVGEADGYDTQFFRDADAAYSDCRGPNLPAAVRAQAFAKYGIAQAVRGNVQTAIAAFRDAIKVLDNSSTPNRELLIDILDRVAILEADTRLRTEAIQHAERATSLRAVRSGNESADVAIGTMKVGLVYANMHEYQISEQLLRAALRTSQKACGDCAAVYEVYAGLYALYSAKGDEKMAEKFRVLALGDFK